MVDYVIVYFYNPSNSFNYEIDTKSTKFLLKSFNAERKEEEFGTYWHNGVEIKILLGTYATYYFNSDTPVKAQSKIRVMFSEAQNIDYVLDVVHHCRKFLFYVCRRSNIKLEDIQLYGLRNEKISIEGILHECSKKYDEETDMKTNEKIVKYEFLKEKAILLFPAIEDESLYFEHLCSCVADTKSYGIDRIILNFVAFEREYRNIYNDEFTRSQEYENIKNEILKYLNEIKEIKRGKEKKYVKEFIGTIEKRQNSFADKMKKSLEDCYDLILPFLKNDYPEYNSQMVDDICTRMNKIGLSDIDIKKSIKKVMGYNLRIEE